jgi:hypothetical protein
VFFSTCRGDAPAAGHIGNPFVSVLGTKTLDRGPGFGEGTVNAELFGQKFGFAVLRHDGGQKQTGLEKVEWSQSC